jgi:hypothetical protein
MNVCICLICINDVCIQCVSTLYTYIHAYTHDHTPVKSKTQVDHEVKREYVYLRRSSVT